MNEESRHYEAAADMLDKRLAAMGVTLPRDHPWFVTTAYPLAQALSDAERARKYLRLERTRLPESATDSEVREAFRKYLLESSSGFDALH